MTKKKIEKPKELAEAIPSYDWKEREEYKKENRDWLRRSRRVALRVLDVLDEKNMSQQNLADLLKVSRQQVSKIVKGQENFTFETINKLEHALGIVLMDILDSQASTNSATTDYLAAYAELQPEEVLVVNEPLSSGYAPAFFFKSTYSTGNRETYSAGESEIWKGQLIALLAINTDEFAVVETTAVENKKIMLEHSLAFTMNDNADHLSVSFKINFKAGEQLFIILRITCIFEIKPHDFLISDKDTPKRLKLPKDLMTHLAFLTTDTARGVLHAKLDKTRFSNKYLLPIIDLSKAFENDVVFEPASAKAP